MPDATTLLNFRHLQEQNELGAALFAKARYRGLVKNANRAIALLALIDIGKWGRPLTGTVRPA